MSRGYAIGRDRVYSLMKKIGIESENQLKQYRNKKYPYLPRGLQIERPNQVWGTDIMYIRLLQGFIYLVAFIDWSSRYVLSFRISNCLESGFCIEALEEALTFTSKNYIDCLEEKKIQISMDGRGRCHDNIFTERLWRTVKYEEVYLKSYQTPLEAHQSLKEYFNFYNHRRLHQSIHYKTPAEIYFSK